MEHEIEDRIETSISSQQDGKGQSKKIRNNKED